MADVIEVNPTDGNIAQLFDRRGASNMSEHRGLRFESEWDKATEAAGFILKTSQLPQVIDALLKGFNVPVKHGAGAATTHAMPDSVNVEPLLGGLFSAANSIAHFRIKNFRATTSNRSQAVLTQQLERLRDRHLEDPLCQMTNFDRGECFNVQMWIKCAQTIQKFQIPLSF